ncbi:MAG: hypothetical protein L0219_08355 [Phycisphaerales bacterium]|nr:hypothetical protein [Phycisphaerales bacterium]MCI0677229.1 hypothetical protein [Phycisphaerales bacterium]
MLDKRLILNIIIAATIGVATAVASEAQTVCAILELPTLEPIPKPL